MFHSIFCIFLVLLLTPLLNFARITLSPISQIMSKVRARWTPSEARGGQGPLCYISMKHIRYDFKKCSVITTTMYVLHVLATSLTDSWKGAHLQEEMDFCWVGFTFRHLIEILFLRTAFEPSSP